MANGIEIETLNKMFEEMVPGVGKADTVAGEIVRATTRIGYRFINDGDMIGVGYGNVTCNAAARYLIEKVPDTVEIIEGMWGERNEDMYEGELGDLIDTVVYYIDFHPELKSMPNKEDMFDYRDAEVDVEDDEDEEW